MESKLQSICSLVGGEYWDEGTRLYRYGMTISKIYYNGLVGLIFHLDVGEREWETKIITKEKLSPIYSDITLLHSTNTEAYLITRKDNKYGLIFCKYDYIKECLKTEYDNIEIFNNLSYSFLIKSNGLYGIYDAHFINNIIPCSYEKIERAIECRENIFYIVSQKGLKGVCNKHGKLSIPCLFENIEFSYGYFYLTKENLTGVSDATYRIIVPINYEKVFHLGNGIFRIHDNGCMGLYANNTEICPPIYDDIFEDHRYYRNRSFQNGNYIIKKGEYIGVVFENKNIIEAKYESLLYLDQNLYAYQQFGKWGIINDKSRIIIEPIYDAIKSGEYGIGVMLDNHYGLVNSIGEIIIPIKYDTIAYLEGRLFGRIGRKMFLLNKPKIKKQFNFPETFWSDNACGYRSNILLFSFDCNLTSLLPSQND